MAPKNARRKQRGGNNNNGGSAGGNGARGKSNGGGRGGGRSKGGHSEDVIDLTPQNAAATGPGPFGMMGMGMGNGMMMGMPFGGQIPSQFSFGYGGMGEFKASESVTVKLSLEGAARARSMEQTLLTKIVSKDWSLADDFL